MQFILSRFVLRCICAFNMSLFTRHVEFSLSLPSLSLTLKPQKNHALTRRKSDLTCFILIEDEVKIRLFRHRQCQYLFCHRPDRQKRIRGYWMSAIIKRYSMIMHVWHGKYLVCEPRRSLSPKILLLIVRCDR